MQADFALNSSVMAAAPSMTVLNSVNPIPLLYLIVLCIIIAVLGFAISSIQAYKKLWDALSLIIGTLKYTATGLAVAGIGYALYLICNFLAEFGGKIDPIYYAYAVGGYIALTVIGYVAWMAGKRLKAYHAQMKEIKTL
jgi:hypothetical protein